MFLGEFEYKIDDKGRVPVPPRFRRVLREGLVLSQGVERCINVYTPPEWKKLADSLTTGSITRSKLRRLNRAIFATLWNKEAWAEEKGTSREQAWQIIESLEQR